MCIDIVVTAPDTECLTILNGVMAFLDLQFPYAKLAPINPPTCSIRFFWNFVDIVPTMGKCAQGFGFLIRLFLIVFYQFHNVGPAYT